jgi:hypothetical protein
LWTHGFDNHGLLLTSTVLEAFLANSSAELLHELTWLALPTFLGTTLNVDGYFLTIAATGV